MRIADIQDREDLMLITDSQDVRELADHLGPEVEEFDGLFVKIEEGDIVEAYGFEGTVPYLNKTLYPILRENPAKCIRGSNSPVDTVEIYGNVLRIEAKKGKKSLWPHERFYHDFNPRKGSAKIYGLPDGSLLIKGKKRLWKKFNYLREGVR